MKIYPVSRTANLVVQEMDGEVLIYDLSNNKAFCLNETSALVWQLCNGKKTVAEISEFISQKLNSSINEDLVWFALDQLKKEKLIENRNELPDEFEGMSRREVIKKIGLGSMIALPVIAAIVAPTSINAQSCLGSGAMATIPIMNGNNADCMTLCCSGTGTADGAHTCTATPMDCVCSGTCN